MLDPSKHALKASMDSNAVSHRCFSLRFLSHHRASALEPSEFSDIYQAAASKSATEVIALEPLFAQVAPGKTMRSISEPDTRANSLGSI